MNCLDFTAKQLKDELIRRGEYEEPKDVPFSEGWNKKAISLALCYAPEVYPCKDCNGPVIDGYCCDNCGSSDPGSAESWDLMGNFHLED